MSDASLRAVVGADVQNFVTGMQTATGASKSLLDAIKKMDETFVVQNNTLNQSSGYMKQQALAAQTLAQAEKQVSLASTDAAASIDKIGGSSRGILEPLNNAYNVIRKVAYALPGIGISGIFLLLGESIADAFGKSTKEVNDAQAALDAFKKTVDQVVSSNSKEAATVEILVGKIRSGTLSRQETVTAIKELQKIAPDYFAKLNAEKSSIEDVTKAYGAYNNQIVKTIEAQIRIAEITDLVNQRLKQQTETPDATKFINDLIAQGKTLEEINAIVVKGTGEDIRAQAQLAQASGYVTDEQSKQVLLQSKIPAGAQIILSLLQKQADLLKEINGSDIGKLINLPDVKIKDPKDPKKSAIPFGLDLVVTDITVDTTAGLDKKIDKTFLGKIQDQLVASLGSGPTKEFQKAIDNFKAGIANDVIGLGEGVLEDIGAALAGTKNPFANILELLGGFIEDFGKQLIVVGGLSQLIQDLLPEILGPLGPAGAIAVGSLAIITGAALKSLSAKKGVTAFAEGGIVTGPTHALIGEAGPEVVFPLDKLNKFIKGFASNNQQMDVNFRGTVSGRDLLFVHDKAVSYRNLAT